MFTRKTITVPAAGEKKRFDVGGFAVVVASMNLYFDLNDVPKLIFDSEGNSRQPLFPQSVYTGNQGSIFSTFFIEGTPASDGDTIELLLSDDCMNQEINPVLISVARNQLKATIEKATTDSVASFSDLELANSEGLMPKRGVIQSREDDIRYAFDSDPVQGGFGFLLPVPTDNPGLVEIPSLAFLQALRFINETATSQATMTLQLEY